MDTWHNRVVRVAPETGAITTLYGENPGEELNGPRGVCIDVGSNGVFVSDTRNHRIILLSLSGQAVAIAGATGESGSAGGAGPDARFSRPAGLAMDRTGQRLYVADEGNNAIRAISLSRTATSTSFWAISHRVTHVVLAPMQHFTRRVIYPTECPCLLGADWRLRSDAMTDLRLQGSVAS